MLSGARARARGIRAAVMSFTASAPGLIGRGATHRASPHLFSSSLRPTVGANPGLPHRRALRRRSDDAPSTRLVSRGFQGWEGGRGRPIIVRAAPVEQKPPSEEAAARDDDAAVMSRGKKPSAKTRADPTADAASTAAATRVDILADDALGPDHARCRRWVVFSDLHLNRKTSEVCVDVLKAVHREALARDAGILFLGDFWHARGAIPVEPLIEALDAVREWTVPCVMIPGNHDQVTAGGEIHALTPLAAANPARVKILSRPTVWRNALWLPYRRDGGVIKSAVAKAKSEIVSHGGGTLSAIFCHADVIGASMNETFQARDGLDPSTFEVVSNEGVSNEGVSNDKIPVYTGHYHKPHTVPGTRITYVGSPYQVSRAEAGQRKALVVLDTQIGWGGCVEANPDAPDDTHDPVTDIPQKSLLPLNLGPRHFTVKGEDGTVPVDARAGDVVRWTLPLSSSDGHTKDAKETKVSSTPGIETARDMGLIVEVAYETCAAPPRIPEAESLGPAGLYAAYAKAVDLPPEVIEVGKSVLEEVAANVAAADVDGTSVRSLGGGTAPPVSLSMHGVEVEGYGAFTDAVFYPLHDRGVCAVVGDNKDDRCADSNGAGKTTLVMAPMWALTGTSDLRVEGGAGKALTKTDVVNDFAKSARVKLEGTADGVPFWVERRVSRSKLLSLRYGVGDEERTMADSRLTQAAMERDLGASVAARIAFHGQHTVGQLLDANDATLKAALGELVDADTWAEAKALSRKRVSEARKHAAALGADASARSDYVRRTESRLSLARNAANDWAAEVERNIARLEGDERRAASSLGLALGQCAVSSDALRAASARWDAEEAAASAAADAAMFPAGGDDTMDRGGGNVFEVDEAAIAMKAASLEEDAERAREYARELQGKEAAARALAAQAHQAVGKFAGASRTGLGSTGSTLGHVHTEDEGGVGVCTTCLQPIDPRHHTDTLDQLKKDAEATRVEHVEAAAALRAAEAEVAAVDRRRREDAAAANRARADARTNAAAAQQRVRDAQARLRAVREGRVNAHVVAAALARADAVLASSPVPPHRGDQTPRIPTAGPALVSLVESATSEAERLFRNLNERVQDRASASAAAAANPHEREVASLESQVESESAEVKVRQAEVAKAENALATAQRADSAFGTRGIQSYLFEGALGELSARVGNYMDALTGGALAMELRPAAAGDVLATRRKRRSKKDEDESEAASTTEASSAAAEKIEKVIFARSHDGERVQRSLRQLSGGERRRAALALALAHADLASARGGVGCDLLVLDEVLQHLDGEGIARVAALLRSLPRGTVLLTSQADSATSHLFDVVDRVFKTNGASGVATGCDTSVGEEDDEEEFTAEFS